MSFSGSYSFPICEPVGIALLEVFRQLHLELLHQHPKFAPHIAQVNTTPKAPTLQPPPAASHRPPSPTSLTSRPSSATPTAFVPALTPTPPAPRASEERTMALGDASRAMTERGHERNRLEYQQGNFSYLDGYIEIPPQATLSLLRHLLNEKVDEESLKAFQMQERTSARYAQEERCKGLCKHLEILTSIINDAGEISTQAPQSPWEHLRSELISRLNPSNHDWAFLPREFDNDKRAFSSGDFSKLSAYIDVPFKASLPAVLELLEKKLQKQEKKLAKEEDPSAFYIRSEKSRRIMNYVEVVKYIQAESRR